MPDNLRNKDNRWATYTERYDQYIRAWNVWITEANNDMAFFIGDQWTANEKGLLKDKRRNAFVFNKIKRVVKIVSGYQRKNRLSFKVDPNHSQDSMDASIWSDTLQYVMRSGNGFDNGYSVMSDAFEQGALKIHGDIGNEGGMTEEEVKNLESEHYSEVVV